MKINLLYDVGQTVEYSTIEKRTITEDCDFCGGLGIVYGLNNTPADCPECHGRGKKFCKRVIQEVFNKNGVISNYVVTQYNGKPKIVYWLDNTKKCIEQKDIVGVVK